MIIFKHPEDLSNFIVKRKTANRIIGFVPTMGALHEGHIDLVTRARNDSQLVVCSIFINPTQFNDPGDYEKYPTTIEKDIGLLEKAGCDILFLPSLTDMYPGGITPTRHYELGFLATILEGKFRPGHFQGVCQVVHRLLDIVIPDKLYLGQKDFQQCMVLKKLVEVLGINTKITICPTHREPDGLAMSSRNMRLNESERKKAPVIYEALFSIKKDIKNGNFEQLKKRAKQLLTDAGFKIDYLEIFETGNFQIAGNYDSKKTFIALAAAYLNEVRLIDNIILNDVE
ncbi:MAG: pantoate--beta-alanine ligase [Ferruginibacter sp.]|nr:pantoate--beta-alanine ligase [Ferruginibacter sp.]